MIYVSVWISTIIFLVKLHRPKTSSSCSGYKKKEVSLGLKTKCSNDKMSENKWEKSSEQVNYYTSCQKFNISHFVPPECHIDMHLPDMSWYLSQGIPFLNYKDFMAFDKNVYWMKIPPLPYTLPPWSNSEPAGPVVCHLSTKRAFQKHLLALRSKSSHNFKVMK